MRLRAKRNLRLIAAGTVLAAAAATAPPVLADPGKMPTTSVTRVTRDGWKIKIELTDLVLNRIGNLAASPTTREGYFDATAIATVSGNGTSDIEGAKVELYVLIGCQFDMSAPIDVKVDGSLSVTPSLTVSPKITGTAEGTGGGPTGGSGTGSVTPSIGADIGIEGEAQVGGSVAGKIGPGGIKKAVIGEKQLKKRRAGVSVRGIQAKVDGCGGNVGVRLGAALSISTEEFDNEVHTHSMSTWI